MSPKNYRFVLIKLIFSLEMGLVKVLFDLIFVKVTFIISWLFFNDVSDSRFTSFLLHWMGTETEITQSLEIWHMHITINRLWEILKRFFRYSNVDQAAINEFIESLNMLILLFTLQSSERINSVSCLKHLKLKFMLERIIAKRTKSIQSKFTLKQVESCLPPTSYFPPAAHLHQQ